MRSENDISCFSIIGLIVSFTISIIFSTTLPKVSNKNVDALIANFFFSSFSIFLLLKKRAISERIESKSVSLTPRHLSKQSIVFGSASNTSANSFTKSIIMDLLNLNSLKISSIVMFSFLTRLISACSTRSGLKSRLMKICFIELHSSRIG